MKSIPKLIQLLTSHIWFLSLVVILITIVLFDYYKFRQKHREMKRYKDKCKNNNNLDAIYLLYSGIFSTETTPIVKDPLMIQVLIEEYKMTQEMLEHYDKLNWQIGSILIGSNLIALGSISKFHNNQLVLAIALAGSFSIFSWMLWYFRHAAIYNIKNDRLYMIENLLNMYQHRMVGYASQQKWLTPFPGRVIALIFGISLIISWALVVIL